MSNKSRTPVFLDIDDVLNNALSACEELYVIEHDLLAILAKLLKQ